MVNDVTTAAKLQSMTDRSRFEYLATSVLRKAEPRYAAIIHTGVNAQGETIVSPIDGLHLIPHSDPPHYVFVQQTTTDRKRLRSKWLTAKDADFSKASVEVKKIRQKQPHAVFTVVLCTNQRVDKDLACEIYQRAEAERVAVDIWEQSRLTDFLDTSAEGHWLRKLYLGIEAEQLSKQLLQQLGRRSLEMYFKDILLPGHAPLVSRDAVEDILRGVSPGGYKLCIIAGRSGYGKSVATAQSLERWLSSGSLGMWLPASFLRDAATLESALDAWLRALHPLLQSDVGRVAMGLATEADPLLVCVDDINRTPATSRLFRFLVSLAARPSNTSGDPTEGAGTSRHNSNPVYLILPVWPEHLSTLPAKVLDQPSIRTLVLGGLLPNESSGMIRAKLPQLSALEAGEYANRLGHDPFLVGLFTLMADEGMDGQQLVSVADDAVGRFLDERLGEAARGNVDLLPKEMLAVMTGLAREMLVRRNLRPLWSDLQSWMGIGSEALRGLRALVQQDQVCKLDAEERLEFRHDRLQERFLVNAMADLLRLPNPPEDIISDPFYSSVVGKALARTELPPEQLCSLRSAAPLVLFQAIQQVVEPSSKYHLHLFQEAHSWALNDSRGSPYSVVTAISWKLLDTDSSRILPIIDAMEPNQVLMLAGLRNGSAQHGMRYVRSISGDFEPGMVSTLRDRIIEHATHRFGERIGGEIRAQLGGHDLPTIDAPAYLALLGHFRLPAFDREIGDIWERHQDEVLPYAVWAAARCPLKNVNEVLGPLLQRIAALPVRENHEGKRNARKWSTLYLGWAFRRGITPEALHFLIQAANQDETLRPDISLMVEGVDHPDAAEYVVRHVAAKGWSNFWSELTGIGDGEPKVQPRSLPTTERLRALWQSPNEVEEVRTVAFAVWLQATGCKDIALLKTIDPQYPFFRYALQHRVKLGDPSAASDLLSLIRADDLHGWWWVLAHRVWCNELRLCASEALAKLQGTIPSDFSNGSMGLLYELSELLVKIPVADAEDLIGAHWGHLKYSPRVVHAAFRIGTPTCVALANESLSLCPKEVDIFQLAFSTIWNQINRSNPIGLRHLRNLEPYLDRMKHNEILFLAWETERSAGSNQDVAEWIRHHLVPRLPNGERTRVQVADEMLISHLDRCLQETQYEPWLGPLFEERGGQQFVFPGRQLRILDGWLSSNRSVRGLLIAGECLRHIGTRKDLEILDRYPVEGNLTDIARIKADARFAIRKRSLE